MLKRTRYDIYLAILGAVRSAGACPITRLSYAARLPVDRTKTVVEFLLSRGLLKEVNIGDRKLFRITDKGGEFLEALRTIRKFIEE